MGQRRHHYERAFERYLRARRIPFVSVNEARKAVLPEGARLEAQPGGRALKSFDFVVYGDGVNLLVDVKGRRVVDRARRRRAKAPATKRAPEGAETLGGWSVAPVGRLETWVTQDDVDSLGDWARLFGSGFEPAFVFAFWCDDQPPDALFEEMFEDEGRWYALRTAPLDAYRESMKPRSASWRTVHVPTAVFNQISEPFSPPTSDRWRSDAGDHTRGAHPASLLPAYADTAGAGECGREAGVSLVERGTD